MSPRLAMVAAARRCVGTKWVHQGRQPGRALDCVGLLIEAVKGAGFDPRPYLETIPNYGTLPTRRLLHRWFEEKLVRVPLDDLKVADFALMTIRSFPMHCAMTTDRSGHGGEGAPFGLIHTWTAAGFVCEHDLREPGKHGILGFYRLPELA